LISLNGDTMNYGEMEGLYKEFEGKWCRVFFENDTKAIFKILKVSGDSLLCQNVRGSKKLVSAYEVRNLEEFTGIIRATGEQVENGAVKAVETTK